MQQPSSGVRLLTLLLSRSMKYQDRFDGMVICVSYNNSLTPLPGFLIEVNAIIGNQIRLLVSCVIVTSDSCILYNIVHTFVHVPLVCVV